MPQGKLTIVPVTLHSENKSIASSSPSSAIASSICTIIVRSYHKIKKISQKGNIDLNHNAIRGDYMPHIRPVSDL